MGPGTSARDYHRLKAALDRLQSTSIATSIRQSAERRMHGFSRITEWQERTDRHNRPLGVELILPDRFYSAVLDNALVLSIDRAYFALTGVSNAGSTASRVSMAAGSSADGVSIVPTSMQNPEV